MIYTVAHERKSVMATYEYELGEVPTEARAKELWLQHAAGFILFQDAREYAIEEMDSSLDEKTKQEVLKGINDALYGMMMIIDGIAGPLENDKYRVALQTVVNLIAKKGDDFDLVEQIDLAEGDGMCMGYHGWMENDFGKDNVATKEEDSANQ